MLEIEKKALQKGYLITNSFIVDNERIINSKGDLLGRVYQDKYEELLKINLEQLSLNNLEMIFNKILKINN